MQGYFGEPISIYTASEALADGVLIDVGAMASELFRHKVLMSRAAWEDCVVWTDEDAMRTGAYQDQPGRLWDVLWMTYVALKRSTTSTTLHRISREVPAAAEPEAELISLSIGTTSLDDGAMALVLSLPGED